VPPGQPATLPCTHFQCGTVQAASKQTSRQCHPQGNRQWHSICLMPLGQPSQAQPNRRCQPLLLPPNPPAPLETSAHIVLVKWNLKVKSNVLLHPAENLRAGRQKVVEADGRMGGWTVGQACRRAGRQQLLRNRRVGGTVMQPVVQSSACLDSPGCQEKAAASLAAGCVHNATPAGQRKLRILAHTLHFSY